MDYAPMLIEGRSRTPAIRLSLFGWWRGGSEIKATLGQCGPKPNSYPHNGYLIFQDGIPEVEEFIRKFHK
jgi:hypothetical protein